MKGIIFDFNGTMFQDSHLHEAAWVHMVKKYSKGELTEHDISVNLHGRTNKEILNFFVSDSLTDEEIEKLSYEKEAFACFLCGSCHSSRLFYDREEARSTDYISGCGLDDQRRQRG